MVPSSECEASSEEQAVTVNDQSVGARQSDRLHDADLASRCKHGERLLQGFDSLSLQGA